MVASALALEDGSVFRGESFGALVSGEGEVVFNTCMTGYQEITTDPSYGGQIVALTYPLIGNYGISHDHDESRRPWIAGLIVREYYDDPSNWKSTGALGPFLRKHGIPALSGIDTRALTRRLRARGTMRAVIVHDASGLSDEDLAERARAVRPLSDQDFVQSATVTEPYDRPASEPERSGLRVVLIDCGAKENIVRSLARRRVDLTVVPYGTSAGEILALRPNGIVVSNGPGDPARLSTGVTTIRELLDSRVPLLGICLGHQLLGMAIGARTSRLRFGHHGGNHPVKDVRSGAVHITSQNHEFQVDAATVSHDTGFYISQINLNDRSVEGLTHEEWPVFSVQYHPEGAPGPQDNQYIFDHFISLFGKVP